MKERPDGFDESALLPELAAGWGIAAQAAAYQPVGFGSYHWTAVTGSGERFFVTVDDLDRKPWLGSSRDAVLAALDGAYGAAAGLRGEAALDFVVAPLAARGGGWVRRVGERHVLAVFPYVEGDARGFDDALDPRERSQLVELLARLHRAEPPRTALRVDVARSGRAVLSAALADLHRPWSGGPYAEPARDRLARSAERVRDRVDALDRRSACLVGRPLVVTHGEPHPGNLLRRGDELLVVDWDTVALAVPERDLWMLVDAEADAAGAPDPTVVGAVAAEYAEATGRALDPEAIAVYRSAWDLADLAAYLDEFRAPHAAGPDADESWANLTRLL